MADARRGLESLSRLALFGDRLERLVDARIDGCDPAFEKPDRGPDVPGDPVACGAEPLPERSLPSALQERLAAQIALPA